MCYGTRPQVIKASVLADVLGREWPLLTMDTGQHYDYELNALLYEQLGVRRPDVLLGVGSAEPAVQTSAILSRAAAVFARRRPWAVVVIGDTNSTLGCALAAVQARIPVVHVEAGLRATDLMMAEEVNRRVVDAISSVLCAPSANAEERLRAERVGGTVVLTGDVARDVLMRNLRQAPPLVAIRGWPLSPDERFTFTTLHRAELTDAPESLTGVVRALGTLDYPVVLPAHPRTRAALGRLGLLDSMPSNIHVLPPLGYFEVIACIREAEVVITDSGGVQREAYWLGTPCITARRETEWQETVALGANVLVPPDQAEAKLGIIVRRHGISGRDTRPQWNANAYGAGDAATLVSAAVAVVAPRGSD